MQTPPKRCGDAGGKNSWGEPCKRVPPPGKPFCDLHDPDVDLCDAKSSDGDPCRRQRILGGTRCPKHSGSTQSVKNMARQRLFEANFAALRFLREALEANDKYLAFKAAAHITRLANATRIEVEHTQGGPPAWLKWLPLDRRAQLAEWVNEARAAMARGEPPIGQPARLTDGRFAPNVTTGPVIDVEAQPVDESREDTE